MYAIIESGGKQYTVKAGDMVYLEKLDGKDDATITFDKVLAVGNNGSLTFGAPYVEGATVTGRLVKTARGKKITVFTYRPKKDSKRKMGHRQMYSKVEILKVAPAKASKTEAASATE